MLHFAEEHSPFKHSVLTEHKIRLCLNDLLGWYHPLRCVDMHGVNKNVLGVVFVQKLWGHQSLERCTRLGGFVPLLDPRSGAEPSAVS